MTDEEIKSVIHEQTDLAVGKAMGKIKKVFWAVASLLVAGIVAFTIDNIYGRGAYETKVDRTIQDLEEVRSDMDKLVNALDEYTKSNNELTRTLGNGIVEAKTKVDEMEKRIAIYHD